jgi:hypothetical protein
MVLLQAKRRPSSTLPTVTLDIVEPAAAGSISPPWKSSVPDGAAVRCVPLLAVLKEGNEWRLAVGDIRITVYQDLRTSLVAVVRGLWLASAESEDLAATPKGWRSCLTDEHLVELLSTALRSVPHGVRAEPEGLATEIAKAHAEQSRNGVGKLREFRYGLEHALGESLRSISTHQLESVLADVIELSTIVGRVSEEARHAAREGMGAWITYPPVYHAQRRMMDPTLPSRPGRRRAIRQPWFAILDAGVRQCQAMEREASEECPLLHVLLNAASTIAVTREAKAQETFNLVAVVGGVLFGVSALILALYDASSILPLRVSNAVVLAPLAISGLLAACLAAVLPGRSRSGRGRRFAAVLAAVLVMLLVLIVSGTLVSPEST